MLYDAPMIFSWRKSDGTPDYRNMTIAYLGAWFLFRLGFCAAFELVGDEAYYWLWSKHLAWNYYSKGPGIAAVIRLGTALFGDHVFGIRFPSVLLSLLSGWGLFTLARRLFSERVGWWTVVVSSVLPLFVVGSVLMTIDPISVFFWIVAANVFWMIRENKHPAAWFGLGLLIALGALGKYTNVAQIACFLMFALWDAPSRRNILSYRFLFLLAGFSLCLIPVLGWNAQHDWITFTHLSERGAVDEGFRISLSEWFGFWSAQFLVLTPFFFIGLAASFFNRRLRAEHPSAWRYLVSLFAPLFAFYVLLGLNDSGQPNWTVPSLVGGIILMTAAWLDWTDRYAWPRWAVRFTFIVLFTLVAAFHILVLVRLPTEHDFMRRIRGGRDLGEQTAVLQEKHDAPLVIGSHYQIASLIAFYHPERPRTYVPHSDKIENQFYFWPTYGTNDIGKNALFINKSDRVQDILLEEFASVQPLEPIVTRFQGRKEYAYHVFLCSNYLGSAVAQ